MFVGARMSMFSGGRGLFFFSKFWGVTPPPPWKFQALLGSDLIYLINFNNIISVLSWFQTPPSFALCIACCSRFLTWSLHSFQVNAIVRHNKNDSLWIHGGQSSRAKLFLASVKVSCFQEAVHHWRHIKQLKNSNLLVGRCHLSQLCHLNAILGMFGIFWYLLYSFVSLHFHALPVFSVLAEPCRFGILQCPP